jgi:hypothetical protein
LISILSKCTIIINYWTFTFLLYRYVSDVVSSVRMFSEIYVNEHLFPNIDTGITLKVYGR